MKQVLIGCGVVVLLGLLFFGYVAYRLWPNLTNMQGQWAAAGDELTALERDYPFDAQAQQELDPARFDRMLDVRVELADFFTGVGARMEAMEQAQEADDGPGWIVTWQGILDQIAPVLTEVTTRLRSAQMSPQEFAFHNRVMWAVLARVDDNLAGEELEELRGRYTSFEELYEAMRKDQPQLLALKDLLAGLPPAAIKSAEQLMAADIPRVSRAIAVTDVDHLYLQPQRFKEVQPVEALPPPTRPVTPYEPASRPAPDPASDPAAGPAGPAAPAAPVKPAPTPVEPAPR